MPIITYLLAFYGEKGQLFMNFTTVTTIVV